MRSRRIISFLIAAMMLTTLFGAFSVTFAETCSGSCGENVNWSLDTDTGVLSITGTGETGDYPDVTTVPWYAYKDAVTAVEIGDGVTRIHSPAFSGCSKITSVTFGTGVLPNLYCKGLFPDSYRTIRNITIAEGTTAIAPRAFAECESIVSVSIPVGVTKIEDSTFLDCSGLTDVTIPDGVTSIGSSAFRNCFHLTAVTIPDSVESINASAFCWCEDLTDVMVGNSVVRIGEMAFYACGSLTDIAIPDSVTSIGASAFHGCTSLTEIRVSEGNGAYTSVDGVLYDGEKTKLVCCPSNKSGSLTIPDGVISLGDDAFSSCRALTAVTIPDSVTDLGIGVFAGCAQLKYVDIPTNITIIPARAFSGCTGLAGVSIPAGVSTVGYCAFSECTSLTGITIPDSVTSMGESVFYHCASLVEIKIPRGLSVIDCESFCYCVNLERIFIPESVTIINDTAFFRCQKLKKVYYGGDEKQWTLLIKNKLGIENGPLLAAKVYYNTSDTFVDPAKAFSDIKKSAWYYNAVKYVVNKEYFAGANGKFDPNGDMTRAMFVSVLARMAGQNASNNVKTKFSDVPKGKWYTGAVRWASDNGIVVGSNGRFMPNDPITREQICTILVTYADVVIKVNLAAIAGNITFKDAKDISRWARTAVSACQKEGLIAGSNGYFDPKGKATRAAVAQILMQFDKNFG